MPYSYDNHPSPHEEARPRAQRPRFFWMSSLLLTCVGRPGTNLQASSVQAIIRFDRLQANPSRTVCQTIFLPHITNLQRGPGLPSSQQAAGTGLTEVRVLGGPIPRAWASPPIVLLISLFFGARNRCPGQGFPQAPDHLAKAPVERQPTRFSLLKM